MGEMTNETKLAPCNHCGSPIELQYEGDHVAFVCTEETSCAGTGLLIGCHISNLDTAIAQWNTRAAHDPVEVLKVVEKICNRGDIIYASSAAKHIRAALSAIAGKDHGASPDATSQPPGTVETSSPGGDAHQIRKDARRYRHLKSKDLDTIHQGGVFAGLTPDNIALNGIDLDQAIDAETGNDLPVLPSDSKGDA